MSYDWRHPTRPVWRRMRAGWYRLTNTPWQIQQSSHPRRPWVVQAVSEDARGQVVVARFALLSHAKGFVNTVHGLTPEGSKP